MSEGALPSASQYMLAGHDAHSLLSVSPSLAPYLLTGHGFGCVSGMAAVVAGQ